MDTVEIGDGDDDESYIDTSFETVYWFRKFLSHQKDVKPEIRQLVKIVRQIAKWPFLCR